MRTIKRLVAPMLVAFAPAAALAAGGEEGLSSLVSLAPGSILWTILTFIILLLVLGKFAWGPIVRGLEAREEKIYGAIEQASKDREEAEKLLEEYRSKLSEASGEITDRLARADKQAQATIEQAKADAQAQAEQMLDRAKAEIDGQRDKVAAELKAQVVELASEIAAAAIGDSFDKPEHLDLIKKRLEQAEKNS
jgi:F-type H+-transporting ATPase subunit b